MKATGCDDGGDRDGEAAIDSDGRRGDNEGDNVEQREFKGADERKMRQGRRHIIEDEIVIFESLGLVVIFVSSRSLTTLMRTQPH